MTQIQANCGKLSRILANSRHSFPENLASFDQEDGDQTEGLFCWDGSFASYMLSLDALEWSLSNLIQIIKMRTSAGFIPSYSAGTLKVIPTPLHVLDRISPIFSPFPPFFARVHRLDEAVPTSPKPEPRAKRQWHGRPNTVSAD